MAEQHQFVDGLTGRTFTLVIGAERASTGVPHDDCDVLAEVFPELDCASCAKCHWQARVSGAWFMDQWKARA